MKGFMNQDFENLIQKMMNFGINGKQKMIGGKCDQDLEKVSKILKKEL